MEKYSGQSFSEIREARENPSLKKLPLAMMVGKKKIQFSAEYYIEPICVGIDKCGECKDEVELFIEKVVNEPNIAVDNSQEKELSSDIMLKLKEAIKKLINTEELEMLKNPKMCVCDRCRDKNNNFIEDRKEIYVQAMIKAAKNTNLIIDEDNLRKAIFRK